MRKIDLRTPVPADGREALRARQVRHLKARLLDFGPGGPEVISADQKAGIITTRFPGHTAKEVADRLEEDFGILVALEGDLAVFRLSPQVSFESLDRVWGCLFQLLG